MFVKSEVGVCKLIEVVQLLTYSEYRIGKPEKPKWIYIFFI